MNTAVKKQIVLCTLGTVFEWYEFTVFASLSPIIALLFFPASSHFAAMMATFAVFASGYIMRPIGALFFGHLGDTRGRKFSLLITVFLMSIATFGMGLIPVGYSFSMLVLVLCRLVQGFAASGEYPGGLVLLAEQASPKRKGLTASFGIFATGVGCFLGALVYAITFKLCGYTDLVRWGWRIPFLIAAFLGVFGLILRTRMMESNEFTTHKSKGQLLPGPLKELLLRHWKNVCALLCISILTNVIIYTDLLYLSNYSFTIHKLSAAQMANLYLVITFIYTLAILLFGFLSDYFNKKYLLLTACLLTLGFIYPAFYLTIHANSVWQICAQSILALLVGMILGPFASILAEKFPVTVRYSGVSFILNMAASFFGGTAPFISAMLTQWVGSPLAPVYYLLALALLALISIRTAII